MRASFDGSGSVVVVTGGARGIGAAAAAACAEAGATVIAFDVAPDPCHPGVEQVAVDVADGAAVSEAVAAVVGSHQRIDGLIAGAAIQPRAPALETSRDDWRRVMAVNLDGVVWTCQAVVPHMVRRRSGSVVVFTSGLAATGYRGAAAYAASKAALTAFAKSLAAEVAEHDVRVNVLAPGVVDTAQLRAANSTRDLDHWRATTGIGAPEDVVGPLLFLLSDAATMTGSQLTRERAFPRPIAAAEDLRAHAEVA